MRVDCGKNVSASCASPAIAIRTWVVLLSVGVSATWLMIKTCRCVPTQPDHEPPLKPRPDSHSQVTAEPRQVPQPPAPPNGRRTGVFQPGESTSFARALEPCLCSGNKAMS